MAGRDEANGGGRMGRWLTAAVLVLLAVAAGGLAWPRLAPAWQQFEADATTAAVLRGAKGVDATALRAAHAALTEATGTLALPEPAVELAELVLAMQGLDGPSERRERQRAAIGVLERAVAQAPLAAEAWFKLALLQGINGQTQEAARSFVANLTLDPNSHGELRRKTWLAVRVWPAVQLAELDLLYRPIRTLYVTLGRREVVVNLTFGTPAEALVSQALQGQVLSGGVDAAADYARILSARRP